ncbi:MAG: HEXXH motif-containing putative peptide modification protein [Actinomycetota bacterium]|nr:HEXXH motif-containing putative peptide modification protein [Actinomycetota bacterium]
MPPLWVDLAYFGAIAAVAAIRSGLELRTSLPVRAGFVTLPTLGRLAVESRAPWTLARFDLSSRLATVRVGRLRVTVPERWHGDAPGWEPVRWLQTRIDGVELVVELDDLEPYWRCFGLPVSDRLGPDAVERWRCRLIEALRVLATRHPERLAAVEASVTCLVPLVSRTRLSRVSATSRYAPGAVALTEPVSGVGLATTLVHEVQHFKLNALHDLVPLYRPDAIGAFYSPWRQDPRPLAGLLHGIYAFVGVAEFLRQERELAGLGDAQAELELARYEEQLWLGYQEAATAQGLTALGAKLVAALGTTIERLRGEDLPQDIRRLAEDLVVEHWASWRLRCVIPESAAVEKLAEAWLSGHPAPTDVQIQDRLADNVDDGNESSRAQLARSWVTEPERMRRLARNLKSFGACFPGASEIDVHLVAGEYAEAAQAQSKRIAAGAADSMTWTGLIMAHRRTCTDHDRSSMATRPELIHALWERLTALSSSCDPCELARWMATIPPAYAEETSMSQSARRSRLM